MAARGRPQLSGLTAPELGFFGREGDAPVGQTLGRGDPVRRPAFGVIGPGIGALVRGLGSLVGGGDPFVGVLDPLRGLFLALGHPLTGPLVRVVDPSTRHFPDFKVDPAALLAKLVHEELPFRGSPSRTIISLVFFEIQ